MRALVFDRYGPPSALRVAERDVPPVEDDRVLIQVAAASVNPLDWHAVTGTPYVARLGNGLRRPKRTILGTDGSGRIEAVGRAVTDLGVDADKEW